MPSDELDDLLRAAMLTERLRWRPPSSPSPDSPDAEPDAAGAPIPLRPDDAAPTGDDSLPPAA